MPGLRGWVALLLALAVGSTAATSLAQAGSPPQAGVPAVSSPQPSAAGPPSKEAIAEASARYTRGTQYVKEENYRAALVEFRRAYDLTKEYRVLYNIGQVCNFLQDYVCALTGFETYLNRGAAHIKEDRRAEVEAIIEKLKPRIGSFEVQTLFGADVSIDDVPCGKTPLETPVRLNAGPHKLSVVKQGKIPVTRNFEVAGGDQVEMKVDLMDLAGPPVVVRERIMQPEPFRQFTTLSWVGLGTGAALAIGAGVTGVLALNASSQLKSTSYTGDPSSEAQSLHTRVLVLRTTTDVLAGVAILTFGTTLFLTLTRKPPKTNTQGSTHELEALIGPRGVALQGEF